MTTDQCADVPSRVVLPLRPNAAWVSSEETRAELERHIETHLLLYDELVVQDGRSECTVLETGSFDSVRGPRPDDDRSTIRCMRPGAEFSLSVGATADGAFAPLLAGAPVERSARLGSLAGSRGLASTVGSRVPADIAHRATMLGPAVTARSSGRRVA